MAAAASSRLVLPVTVCHGPGSSWVLSGRAFRLLPGHGVAPAEWASGVTGTQPRGFPGPARDLLPSAGSSNAQRGSREAIPALTQAFLPPAQFLLPSSPATQSNPANFSNLIFSH